MNYLKLIFPPILLIQIFIVGQTPPGQPSSGPGGTNYLHSSVSMSDFTNLLFADGYWLFEPANPKPDSADVVIFNHGWGVYNPGPYGQWIEHLVRKGNIVIFPKYEQNDSFTASTYTPDAATGINNALTELQTNSLRVKPRMNHIAMIGHSFGGVITANLAVQYNSYGTPKPGCFMLCEPGPGTSTGHLSTYSNMDTDYHALIVVGNDDAVVGNTFGKMIFDSTNISTSQKNYIIQYADNSPVIEATHNEPLAANSNYDGGTLGTIITGGYTASKIDAVDFYCYWKLADALLSCTFYGTDCEYAFGDTPQQRDMGNWSNGTPLVELDVYPKATGIKENQPSTLSIYPNPAKESIFIKDCSSCKVEIYDSTGEKIKHYSGNNQVLDISELPQGIYIIKIQSNESIFTQKLIKQ